MSLKKCFRRLRQLTGAALVYATAIASYWGGGLIVLPVLAWARSTPGATLVVPADHPAPIHDRPVPCGWIAGPSNGHAAWPRRIFPSAAGAPCPGPGDPLLVRCTQALSLTAANRETTTVLRVSALEDGWAGKIIHCRSSLNGAVLLGRVIDDATVELVQPDRRTPW